MVILLFESSKFWSFMQLYIIIQYHLTVVILKLRFNLLLVGIIGTCENGIINLNVSRCYKRVTSSRNSDMHKK